MTVTRTYSLRTYRIIRVYKEGKPRQVMRDGLTLREAREWIKSIGSYSRTANNGAAQVATRRFGDWIDYYEPEVNKDGKRIPFSSRP
jgi:hypothetical protein